MNPNYDDRFVTHVPTCALIEDYHSLLRAAIEENWGVVWATIECIANAIEAYTECPAGSSVVPSPSSVINMGERAGIFTNGDNDIRCAAGRPVSNAMSGGVCQCDEASCKYYGKSCFPEDLSIRLLAGCVYAPCKGVLNTSGTIASIIAADERGEEV